MRLPRKSPRLHALYAAANRPRWISRINTASNRCTSFPTMSPHITTSYIHAKYIFSPVPQIACNPLRVTIVNIDRACGLSGTCNSGLCLVLGCCHPNVSRSLPAAALLRPPYCTLPWAENLSTPNVQQPPLFPLYSSSAMLPHMSISLSERIETLEETGHTVFLSGLQSWGPGTWNFHRLTHAPPPFGVLQISDPMTIL